MRVLVGSTGFVGSNLYASGQFDHAFHSTDIKEAYGLEPELLVYAGVRAEKYMADQNPEKDLKHIQETFDTITRIAPKRLVLISTIDVYPVPKDVDEDSAIEWGDKKGYGANRFLLEKMVREHYQNALIVRLPALYGNHIKKNFIYDYLHKIPNMLRAEKYGELSEMSRLISESYQETENGFYKYVGTDINDEINLEKEFEKTGFSTLQFTDSRSVFQFYPLSLLWKHIQTALQNNIYLLNIATEPVSASEIYRVLAADSFTNILEKEPAFYDMKSIHAALLGGNNGYILPKEWLLSDLKSFVEKERGKQAGKTEWN